MKRIIIILLFVISGNVFAQFQEWAKIFNGSGNNNDESLEIVVDGQSNVIITGRVISTGNNNDFCTIKYNSAGVQQWMVLYNGAGNATDEPTGLAVDDAGNVFVTGMSYVSTAAGYDIVTIKYNSAGVQQWVQSWNGSGIYTDRPNAIVTDNTGNVYVTGSTQATSSNYNYVTVKYNQSGIQQWVKIYSGQGNNFDEAYFIQVDNALNVYISGTSTGSGTGGDIFTIKYNSSGDSLWAARYNNTIESNEIPQGFKVDKLTGSVYVTGFTSRTGTGIDWVTIQYNSNGVQQWASFYDTTGSQDIPEDLEIDANGNVYVTGRTRINSGYNDFATVKYNATGAAQWTSIYNNTGVDLEDYGHAIKLDAQGNIYVTGYSQSEGDNSDVLTIRYSNQGVQQWTARYDVTTNEEAYEIALDNTGNVYVTGYQSGLSNSDFLTIKYSQVNGIEQISNEISRNFYLSQNYPNPFNPTTKIRFSIPSVGNVYIRSVQLKIYDILGKEIISLLNQQLQPGSYEAEWDASDIPGGVYFYKLISGDFTETKKMILIK